MKTICITGASSGIGEACAHELAAQGHALILCGRRADRLKILRQHLETTYNTSVLDLELDVRYYKSCQEVVNRHEALFSKTDILINNAGLAAGLAPIHEGQINHWDQMIDTNLKGLLYMSRLISPYMVKRKQGKIILIGSVAGKETYPNGNVYCATKHAVDALARGMRMDLISHGVQVSAIHPGMVETEFSMVRFDGDRERANAVYNNMTPLKGIDVAKAVTWMIHSPEHVHIADVGIYPAVQARATIVNRSNN